MKKKIYIILILLLFVFLKLPADGVQPAGSG